MSVPVPHASAPDGALMMRHLTELARYEKLSGSRQEIDRVTLVELCDSERCSTPAVELQPGVTSPAPSATFSAYQSTSGGPGRWRISVSMNTPEAITVRAYDASSTVIAERDADLAWTSLSESTECPGPSVVDPVELPVGA